jgi:hypothetical protein
MLQPSSVVPPFDNARAEIDALYTPLDEALAQLRERRVDEKLRMVVEQFHSACLPTFLRSKPCAFLGRYLVTPNREFEQFVLIAKASGLAPLCAEATEDIFHGRNREKRRLCRPTFEIRPSSFRGLHIMDGSGRMDGTKLGKLRLPNGMTLPAFHRALLDYAFHNFARHVIDYSQWFSEARREEFYYLHYLALFIRDGILFENFLADDPEELRFARERVIPSFAKAVELFGVRPLIVPLLPRESESHERWRCHGGALYEPARRLLAQKT